MHNKKLLISALSAILLSISLVSCSDEIDLIDAETVPIVYCLLNPSDSVQVIRVSRTFESNDIDSGFSNERMQFSEELEIYLVHEKPDNTQEYIECFLTEIFSRDSGLFPFGGLSLYQANLKIIENHQYSLILYRESAKSISYGTITSLGGELEIVDPRHVPFRLINLFPGQDYYVRFSNVENAFIYQTTLSFEYDEIINGIPDRKFLALPQEFVFSVKEDRTFLEQRISGDKFLRDLESNIEINPDVTRVPICFSFKITCCGEEVYLKVKSDLNANGFSIIDFTNMANARGIFSTVNHQIAENFPLSPNTIDSIALNSRTKELNFLTHAEITSK